MRQLSRAAAATPGARVSDRAYAHLALVYQASPALLPATVRCNMHSYAAPRCGAAQGHAHVRAQRPPLDRRGLAASSARQRERGIHRVERHAQSAIPWRVRRVAERRATAAAGQTTCSLSMCGCGGDRRWRSPSQCWCRSGAARSHHACGRKRGHAWRTAGGHEATYRTRTGSDGAKRRLRLALPGKLAGLRTDSALLWLRAASARSRSGSQRLWVAARTVASPCALRLREPILRTACSQSCSPRLKTACVRRRKTRAARDT